jgi:hypothetical protein
MKKEITKYFCDKCEAEIENPSQFVSYTEGWIGNDVGIDVNVKITRQVSYAISHNESILCNKCKIAILERAIEELKNENKK